MSKKNTKNQVCDYMEKSRCRDSSVRRVLIYKTFDVIDDFGLLVSIMPDCTYGLRHSRSVQELLQLYCGPSSLLL